MAVAPLIKPIQTKKGMFYTFQSSLEDLTLTFNNNTNKFRFSKFALLRLPEIGIPTTLATDNRVQFSALGETPLETGLSTNQNINLALSFQNYALNFESLLISQTAYQREKKLNVSERVFWKWIKELGAIRWRPAVVGQNGEVISTLPTGEKRWAEDFFDSTSSTYDYKARVVQYIGDIDVVNSVRNKDNSYSELYIHVPTNVGNSPTVLFNSKPDVNYHPSMIINNTPSDPLDNEFLNGRHWTESHPYAGMNLTAFYDLDDGLVEQKQTDTLNTVVDWGTISPSYWWGAHSTVNAYYTDQAAYFGGLYESVVPSMPKNQKIHKSYTDGNANTRTVEYLRSTLDGILVDFELSNYQIASENPNIKTLAQLNDSVNNHDFDFNAILIYYDIFDPIPPANSSEPAVVTNLYGIYFLNKVEQTGIDFAIPMITKEKPDVINRTNGNAFAHKINMKFDTSIEDVAVEKSINDYSTFGLDLFLDVLTELRRIQTTLNDKLAELENLSADLANANKSLYSTSGLDALAKQDLLFDQELTNITDRVILLENAVFAQNTILSSGGSVMQLLTSINQQLSDLYDNRTSILMDYNLAPFKNGYGISLDKSVPGQMTILNSAQMYSKTSQINLASTTNTIANICTLDLGVSNTYTKHYKPISNTNLNPSPMSLITDLEIRINDSINKWKLGQVVKFVIDTQIICNDFTINIKTDATNLTNQVAPYSRIITTLSNSDFPENYGRTGRPIIEITCTDSVNLTFQVDKIIR
jgi:hypothetical protein